MDGTIEHSRSDLGVDRSAAPRSRWFGVMMMLTGATSNQVGAGTGAHAFDTIGPAGVVAVRQVVAAAVLLPVARPPLRRMTWGQWWPTLLLAAVFACMNLTLYTAIDRIGLGLAVTLEFLGPLAVALASSRNRTDLLTAAVAAAGVYVLVRPGPSSDYMGLGLGIAAGACWAAYIILNRLVGARLPGLPLLYAVAAGLLSSVVPYAADLTALRVVPARLFGIFMSTHPVLAALVGVVLLGQLLALHQWVGIALVVTANAAAVTAAPRAALPSR